MREFIEYYERELVNPQKMLMDYDNQKFALHDAEVSDKGIKLIRVSEPYETREDAIKAVIEHVKAGKGFGDFPRPCLCAGMK